jgi:catechol 2,3-dioxygenase-like lactoylglutathione lyase family enzyme
LVEGGRFQTAPPWFFPRHPRTKKSRPRFQTPRADTAADLHFAEFGAGSRTLSELNAGIERWTFANPMTRSFRIIAADHTGFTVANIERSLAFWRDVLGFELSHRAHHTGDLAGEITGVPGAEISLAVLKAPGHKIELLEYHTPADRKKHFEVRPCDAGSAHIALTVNDLDAVLETIAASGWKAAGQPQTLKSGPNAGKRVVYVRDPDGTTIEFMQPPKKVDG